MSKYSLKPGIIHIGQDAISPFTHTNTIILDKSTSLETYLDQLYEKYHNRNKPILQYLKFSIQPSEWKASDTLYRVSLGKLNNDKYRLYNVITNLGLDIQSSINLVSEITYKFIKLELSENELFAYCNIHPSKVISGDILISYFYNSKLDVGIPKNLEIQLQKEQFTKVDDLKYMYKLNLPELDNTLNYHISCTFDLDNITKFMLSNNRYIVAEYSYGEVIIYTEFPFTAKVLLIIHII